MNYYEELRKLFKQKREELNMKKPIYPIIFIAI